MPILSFFFSVCAGVFMLHVKVLFYLVLDSVSLLFFTMLTNRLSALSAFYLYILFSYRNTRKTLKLLKHLHGFWDLNSVLYTCTALPT